MNLLPLIEAFPLDRRSKIPLDQQLFKHFYRLISEAKIPSSATLPPQDVLAETLEIPMQTVESVIDSLRAHGFLKQKDTEWHVNYAPFTYDLNAEYSGIADAITHNGFTMSMVKHDSRLIKADKAIRIHPGFKGIGDLYEIRVDYYADHLVFGITLNYVPAFLTKNLDDFMAKKDRLNELYQPHVNVLHKTYSHKAVLFPDFVSAAFNVTPGHAGTLIEMEYHDDINRLMHVYHGYITSRYVLTLNHARPRIAAS